MHTILSGFPSPIQFLSRLESIQCAYCGKRRFTVALKATPGSNTAPTEYNISQHAFEELLNNSRVYKRSQNREEDPKLRATSQRLVCSVRYKSGQHLDYLWNVSASTIPGAFD